MDVDRETRQFKRLLRVGFVFLVATFYGCREFKYAVWGQVAEARVIDTRQVSGRWGTTNRLVNYEFKDRDGKMVRDSDVVAMEYPVAVGEHGAAVQYLPGGEDVTSRLEGHRNLTSVYVFFGCLVLMGVFVWPIVREGREHAARKRAGR